MLQTGTFERVGGNQPIQVDVRVIAATNKPLEAAVAAKQFREDLFYRLNVVRIHIPPLRDRREDIPLLVNYFLKKIAREQQRPPKSIAASVIKTLEKYHWPGNVRELENAIRRAHVMAKSDAILLSDLPPEISGQSAAARPCLPVAGVAGEAASDRCRRARAAIVSMGQARSEIESHSRRRTRTGHPGAQGNERQPGSRRQTARHHARDAAQTH